MDDQPEIWFERWGWSYVPCTLKGVAVTFGLVALLFLTALPLSWLTTGEHAPFLYVLAAAPPIAGFIWAMALCERHSRPWP